MKLKVIDQLSVSSVGPGTMGKDTEFEVTDSIGEDLIKRGLAYPANGSRPEKGKAGAPLNKQIEPASNKIIGGKAMAKNSVKGKAAQTGETDGESAV